MSTATQYLDLDAIKPAQEFKVKLGGQEHILKETDVETFILNTEDVQKLGLLSNAVEELKLSLRLVSRAFPTIPEPVLQKLTFSQCNALIEFARTANGEVKVTEEMQAEADATADPQTAGK